MSLWAGSLGIVCSITVVTCYTNFARSCKSRAVGRSLRLVARWARVLVNSTRLVVLSRAPVAAWTGCPGRVSSSRACTTTVLSVGNELAIHCIIIINGSRVRVGTEWAFFGVENGVDRLVTCLVCFYILTGLIGRVIVFVLGTRLASVLTSRSGISAFMARKRLIRGEVAKLSCLALRASLRFVV